MSSVKDKTDMETFFILDQLRQRREKKLRQKKDDLINEMAFKMKQEKMAQKNKKNQSNFVSYGGFVGVERLGNQNCNNKRIIRKKRHDDEDESAPESVSKTDRTDLLIMGMIRDEKEKKFHEEHQVR